MTYAASDAVIRPETLLEKLACNTGLQTAAPKSLCGKGLFYLWNLDFPRHISVETARQWMHKLGFTALFMYFDGHEREDVVEECQQFLKTMAGIGFAHPEQAPTHDAGFPKMLHSLPLINGCYLLSLGWAPPGLTFIFDTSRASAAMALRQLE